MPQSRVAGESFFESFFFGPLPLNRSNCCWRRRSFNCCKYYFYFECWQARN